VKSSAAGWKEANLGDICTFNYGKSLPQTTRNGGEVFVYGSNGIVGHHNSAITTGKTIVIGRKGSYGEVNYSAGPCWPIDTTYFVDEKSTQQDIKWLSYRLAGLGLNQLNKAAAIPGLNREDAYRQQLLVPPLPEQRRIATILDQADALRAKRREALAQLDSLTQSIFIEMFGEPDENVKGLPVEMLGTLCKRITDGTHQSPEWESSGVPFLFISNIVDGQITFDTHKFISAETYLELTRRCPIELGDVLYTTVGSYGNAAVVKTNERFAFQRHIAHIKPDMGKAIPLFLAAMIQSTGVRRQVDKVAKGVAQKTVNLADLKSLMVFAPPLTMQQAFATRIQAVEILKVAQRAALTELDSLFASIQHRAFRGEL
jgi:type I restriction enzyme S subunit